MRKNLKRICLNRETLRRLDAPILWRIRGGGTQVAACISAEGYCTTWAWSDCGDCPTTKWCGPSQPDKLM